MKTLLTKDKKVISQSIWWYNLNYMVSSHLYHWLNPYGSLSFSSMVWVLYPFWTVIISYEYLGSRFMIYNLVVNVFADYTDLTGKIMSIMVQCLQKLPASSDKFTSNNNIYNFNYLLLSYFYCFLVFFVSKLGVLSLCVYFRFS